MRMAMEEEHFDLIQGSNLAACLLSGEKGPGQQHLEELSGHLRDNQALLQMEDDPALLPYSSRKDGDSECSSPGRQPGSPPDGR